MTSPRTSAVAATRAATTTRSAPGRTGRIVVHIILIAGAVIMISPFVFQVMVSIETYAESVSVPMTLIPSGIHWSNYTDIFYSMPFGTMLLNSVWVTVGRTFGQLVFCTLAGYAFARLTFRGSRYVFMLFLAVTMTPHQLYILPQYEIISELHLLNTIPALILPGMFSAFGTFLMRQFFLQLPREIQDAAYVDGAGPFQIFWRIMLPLAQPGLVALGLLVAIWSWNDLLWPLVVNTDTSKMPVSAGLANLKGQYATNYPVLMAGSLMASLPLIIMFVVFQRRFIEGIAFSGRTA